MIVLFMRSLSGRERLKNKRVVGWKRRGGGGRKWEGEKPYHRKQNETDPIEDIREQVLKTTRKETKRGKKFDLTRVPG